MTLFSLTVPGIPRPQGSKRHLGKGVMVESSKHLAPWRAAITAMARQAMAGRAAFDDCVRLVCVFTFPRPKSHLTGDGKLTRRAPRQHRSKPDLSKLVRAVEDALTDAGVWRDDSIVCSMECSKRYGDPTESGVRIEIVEP